MSARRGTTLVEIVVSLAVLAIICGVATLAIASLKRKDGPSVNQMIQQAKMDAVRTGRPVPLFIDTLGAPHPVSMLALPDGRVVGSEDSDSPSADSR